jgi:hypothetical protein
MKATPHATLQLDRAPVIPATRQPASPRWWAALALCWPAVTAVCMALEPAADGEAGVIGNLLGTGFLIVLLGAVGSAVGRRQAAFRWAAAAGLTAGAMTLACPLTAHHAGVGLWWAGQWAAVAAGAALTIAAWHRLRAS